MKPEDVLIDISPCNYPIPPTASVSVSMESFTLLCKHSVMVLTYFLKILTQGWFSFDFRERGREGGETLM